jgi:hypothetical protein
LRNRRRSLCSHDSQCAMSLYRRLRPRTIQSVS